MRTSNSHPWINFQLDLTSASHRVWLLLGEVKSKIEHIRGTPLHPKIQESFYQLSLVKGVLATTAIEGNTLSEEEVSLHLQQRLHLPPSKEYLQREIQNIVDACNLIGGRVFEGEPVEITTDAIKEFNRYVLRGLPLGEDVVPGVFRAHSVLIGPYRGAPAAELDDLMHRLCAWLNEPSWQSGELPLVLGILKAIVGHLYLVWIHPFGDGNGRTARLIEFRFLLSAGVPGVAAHLLSNHYNQTRSEYYRRLAACSKGSGDPLVFIEYALQGFVDGLRAQIDSIRGQQLSVHWTNYVYDQFRGRETEANTRRRKLVLALSNRAEPVTFLDLASMTPELAVSYSRKTTKTLQRDMNELRRMGLVARTGRGYRAVTETMAAFLPKTRAVRKTTGAAS